MRIQLICISVFLYLSLSTMIDAAVPIKMSVEIRRYAFTGEHYMYDAATREIIFKKLFDNGQLKFLNFEATKIVSQSLDYGSKTPIGKERYELTFKDKRALHKFTKSRLPDAPRYDFYGGLERGLFIAIRDYALSKKDRVLISILKSKKKETKNSADETLDELYRPLR